ncbi:MAG: hypothetical protein ABII82_01980 [Verrucomicrobiota bacterium]
MADPTSPTASYAPAVVVRAYLAKHAARLGACPLCTAKDWSFIGLAAALAWTDAATPGEQGYVLTSDALPLVAIQCGGCSYVLTFSWLAIKADMATEAPAPPAPA